MSFTFALRRMDLIPRFGSLRQENQEKRPNGGLHFCVFASIELEFPHFINYLCILGLLGVGVRVGSVLCK